VNTAEGFSMRVLAARTGTKPATIRHYLALGLLPEPVRVRRNRFVYDERHVAAVRLVRALRERRGLPLEEVRALLPELMGGSDEEAFRPEVWERALEAYLELPSRRSAAVALARVAAEDFARASYAEVTVDDVCARAGVAKGSFYRYFASKEELFFAAAEAVAGELARKLDALAPCEEQALTSALAAAMAPRLALLLELVARVAQRRPGYARVARRVVEVLGDAAAARLADRRGRGAHGRGVSGGEERSGSRGEERGRGEAEARAGSPEAGRSIAVSALALAVEQVLGGAEET
jgi:AcrR family transcriptional regulator